MITDAAAIGEHLVRAVRRLNHRALAISIGEVLSTDAAHDVERTEDLLDEETFALKDRRAIDLVSFIRRKNQGLLEITRAARALRDYEVEPVVTDRLASLKEKLERNQAVLRLHLEAVREVAEAEGVKLGQVAQPLRAALTGRATSPGIFDVLALLGREESLARVADQLKG